MGRPCYIIGICQKQERRKPFLMGKTLPSLNQRFRIGKFVNMVDNENQLAINLVVPIISKACE